VNKALWGSAFLLFWLTQSAQGARPAKHRHELNQVNCGLHGKVIDHTHNHGADRRIWSAALNQKRDLYVYLPPDYKQDAKYPFVLWLHGFAQDEQSFLKEVVPHLDRAIACGQLPPLIAAAPDGSLCGEPSFMNAGSFFINSKAGRFEDYIVEDVLSFVLENYPIRPEREAHAVAGVSMGGGAAYNLAIKHRDRFKAVVGIFPPLNWRWIDCHCRYMGNFDPCCWGWRTSFSNQREVVGRFYGIVKIRMKNIIGPLFDISSQTAAMVSQENPIEMIDRLSLQPGELCLYVGYGGKDEFNLDAQIESFLYRAKERGLSVTVDYLPRGRHNYATALKLLPGVVNFLNTLLTPYSPNAAKSPVVKLDQLAGMFACLSALP
jgi:S-formylglutathione hydrolase FrmB